MNTIFLKLEFFVHNKHAFQFDKTTHGYMEIYLYNAEICVFMSVGYPENLKNGFSQLCTTKLYQCAVDVSRISSFIVTTALVQCSI